MFRSVSVMATNLGLKRQHCLHVSKIVIATSKGTAKSLVRHVTNKIWITIVQMSASLWFQFPAKDTFRQTKEEQRHLTLQCLTVKPKLWRPGNHKGAKLGFAVLVPQNHAKRCFLCARQRGNRLHEWRLTLKKKKKAKAKEKKQKWVCHYKRQTSLTSSVSQPRGHFSPVFSIKATNPKVQNWQTDGISMVVWVWSLSFLLLQQADWTDRQRKLTPVCWCS